MSEANNNQQNDELKLDDVLSKILQVKPVKDNKKAKTQNIEEKDDTEK